MTERSQSKIIRQCCRTVCDALEWLYSKTFVNIQYFLKYNWIPSEAKSVLVLRRGLFYFILFVLVLRSLRTARVSGGKYCTGGTLFETFFDKIGRTNFPDKKPENLKKTNFCLFKNRKCQLNVNILYEEN